MREILKFPSITGRLYTCNVCSKTEVWGDNWMWKDIFHKEDKYGDPGCEKRYITCSNECREKGVINERLHRITGSRE